MQLISFDRIAEVRFDVEPMTYRVAHARREQSVARLPATLRLVHRDIGVAQHVVGLSVAPAAVHDADAGTRPHGVQLQKVRLLQHRKHAFGDHCGRLCRRHVVQYDYEFVAAKSCDRRTDRVACDGIVHSKILAQPRRYLGEQQVADIVTQTVVDDLEPIKIDEHQREGVAGVQLGVLDRRLQPAVQQGTVR